jgi:hypothetical protein
MAGDLTKSFAMIVAAGIDATGKKAQMIYAGKNVVVARWLSVQRAMMLSNALGSHLGFKIDENENRGQTAVSVPIGESSGSG